MTTIMNFYERYSSNLKSKRHIDLLSKKYSDEMTEDVEKLDKGLVKEDELAKKWDDILEIMSNYETNVGYIGDIDPTLWYLISRELFTCEPLWLITEHGNVNKTIKVGNEWIDPILYRMKRFKIEKVYLEVARSEISTDPTLKQLTIFRVYTKESLLKKYPFMVNKMDNFQECLQDGPGINFLTGKGKNDEFWIDQFDAIKDIGIREYGEFKTKKRCCLDYYFDE